MARVASSVSDLESPHRPLSAQDRLRYQRFLGRDERPTRLAEAEGVLLRAHPYFERVLAGDEAYDSEYHELRVMDLVGAVLGKPWEKLEAADFERLADAAAKWGAEHQRARTKSVKARQWIKPYIREGERVSGYWRDIRSWEEVADELKGQFKQLLSTRNKQGYVIRSHDHWQPPEGWYDLAPLGEGVAQFASELEYEDGKRAIVYVTARHSGKQGVWNVKVQRNSFEKYPDEILKIRDRFAAIDPDLPYDEYEAEAGKLAKELGWMEIGDRYVSKYGDYGVKVRHSAGQKAAIAIPMSLDDFDRRRRFERLLDQDQQEALVVGQTSRAEVESGISTAYGWTMVDRGDNTFDLLYRREGRNAEDLEIKGYRVKFDDQGVLAEVGLPGESDRGMASVDEYKAKIRAEREEAKRLENERNDRVVAITKRVRSALNGMPDLAPPETPAEMKKNDTSIDKFEVGDRFAYKSKVYEVTAKVKPPDNVTPKTYKADEWSRIRHGYSQSLATIDAFSQGDVVMEPDSGKVYKVIASKNPAGYPEWKGHRIQDMETGEITSPGYFMFSLMQYNREGVTARAVSGRGQTTDRWFGPKEWKPDKAWRAAVADSRVGGEAPSVQAARGTELGIDGADWDEVREALKRMNFVQAKRYNRKVAGKPAMTSYTEVWRRGVTGSEVKFTVTVDENRAVKRRFWDHERPYVSTAYSVDAGSVVVTRGTAEADRKRIKGRVPANKEEWRSDILGRADELADHYGETSEATLIVFADQERLRSRSIFGGDDWEAPPDMNAYIDGEGVVVLGRDVLPALQAYSDAAAKGEITDEIRANAWRAWATAQHEINHSVNRAGGWFGTGYSDHDGTKNFEETLTEELARVMVNEWARSAMAHDVADWSQDNAASLGVQGAYQTFRTNFKNLLDEMEIPEEERLALLERWKFNTNWQKRMQEFSEMLSEHLDIPLEDASKKVKDVLSAKRLNNGYTEGVLRVQEFRPILKVGPMPPRRPTEEIERLRSTVKPLRDEWLRLRAQWRALEGPRNDQYLTDEGRALKEAYLKAHEAYFAKLEEFDLAPLYEDYTV